MSAPMVSHSTVIQLARGGDRLALDQLLRAFRPYVRVIVNSVHNGRMQRRLDDSDLIQDALLEAARGFPSFRGITTAEFVMWLRQVARRTALNSMRRLGGTSKRDPARERDGTPVELLTAPSGERPSAAARCSEQADRIAAAMATLPEEMQQVLLLRHVDGLPHAVIAQQMNRAESAIRMQYVRALRRMRELLGTNQPSGMASNIAN